MPSTGAEAIANGASIVIVGGSVVRSADVTGSARKIREAIDMPRIRRTQEDERRRRDNRYSQEVSTPNVSDAMHRKGAMHDIHPINSGVKIVGTAVTVQTLAGDWAKPVEAIDIAGPGNIIVIYNGSTSIAPWGGLATLSCKDKRNRGRGDRGSSQGYR